MGAFDLRLDFERRTQPVEQIDVRRELGGAELLLWITFRNGYPEVAGGTAAGKITGPTSTGTLTYVSNRFGRAFRTSSSTYIYWDDPDHVLDQGAAKWAVAFVGTLGQSAANRCIVNLADPANLSTGFVIKQREFGANNNVFSHNAPNLTRGVFGMRQVDAFSNDFWANGAITRGNVSGSPTTPTNTRFILGRQANLVTDVGADADINDVFLFKDQPSLAAWSKLMASPYTAMFGPELFDIWVPLAAGGIDLAGSGLAQASASGALSQAVYMDAAAGATATASGDLTAVAIDFATASFTGTDGVALETADANWVQSTLVGSAGMVIDANAVRVGVNGTSGYYHNATPPSADYSVAVDLTAKETDFATGTYGVIGRYKVADGSMYYARYIGSSSDRFELYKSVFFEGVTLLGSYASPFPAGTTRNLRLEMIGTAIKVYVDGSATPVISVTDSSITAAGKAGVYGYSNPAGSGNVAVLDNFKATSIGAGGVNLAGAAQGTATTTGELSQSTPLSGVASVNADTAGTLSKAVQMTAVALSVSSAGGNVSVSINPSAAAYGQAAATGSLTVTGNNSLAGNAIVTPNASGGISLAVPMNAAAVAQALSQAALSVGKSLSAGASSESLTSGVVSLMVSLAGSPIAEAAAQAALSVNNSTGLSGAATVNASSLATLSLAIPLSGASVVISGAAGALTNIVRMDAIAASASQVTGGLDLAVTLSADALAQALSTAGLSVQQSSLGATASGVSSSQGVLTIRVNLDAAALASAIVVGALDGSGTLVATPGYSITSPQRAWRVPGSARTWRIAS